MNTVVYSPFRHLLGADAVDFVKNLKAAIAMGAVHAHGAPHAPNGRFIKGLIDSNHDKLARSTGKMTNGLAAMIGDGLYMQQPQGRADHRVVQDPARDVCQRGGSGYSRIEHPLILL